MVKEVAAPAAGFRDARLTGRIVVTGDAGAHGEALAARLSARGFDAECVAADDVTPDTESTWSVWRQDDNGNRFHVRSGCARADAERVCQEFESRGHKQTYWIAPDELPGG